MTTGFLAVLFLMVMPSPFRVEDGPATAELRRIHHADQAVRQKDWSKLTEAEAEQIDKDDTKRLTRVRELLKNGQIVTAEDFDIAALIFQHGRTPDDYLTAHEMALIHMLKGNRVASNMFALSEDRFLQNIGRRQRFNSQAGFGPDGKLVTQPVQEDGDGVTDALRADLFQMTLADYKTTGIRMTDAAREAITRRAKERLEPKWLEQGAKSAESAELKRLAEKPDVAGLQRALELYRADLLRTPEDYLNTARLLLAAGAMNSSGDQSADRFLLAHELAAVAAIRSKKPEAMQVQADALDRFLETVRFGQRYGAYTSPAGPIAPVTSSVRAAMGLKEEIKEKL